MIRRNDSKKTPSVVNSAENETLSVNKGIVRNAGPSDLASVVDSCNFSLRDDGSYALRKPDIVLVDGNGRIFPLKDGKHGIRIGSNGVPVIGDLLADAEDWEQPAIKYLANQGSEPTYTDGWVFDWTRGDYTEGTHKHVYISPEARVTRAGDVTLIPARVDLTLVLDLVDTSLYPSGTVTVPRLLSVYWEEYPGSDGYWVIEVVQPEANTLVNGGEGASFEPNLLLDNPYAIKDLYGYGSVGVQGILAYQNPNDQDIPSSTDSYVEVDSGSVVKSIYDVIFDIRCKNGNLYVGTATHLSLAKLSALFSDTVPSAVDMAELDDDIICYVDSVTITSNLAPQFPTTVSIHNDAKRLSSIIPAHTALLLDSSTSYKVDGGITLSINIKFYAASGEHTFNVYPGTVSLEDAVKLKGMSVLVPNNNTVTLSVKLDDHGNLISNGFGLSYTEHGLSVNVDTGYSGAVAYSLSSMAFSSAADAQKTARTFTDGESLALDATASTWVYYYYTWNLSMSQYHGLDGLSVKDLTESVGTPTYQMVSELNASDARPLILKAVMTFSHDLSNLYGVWESSADGGVSWQPCNEFLKTWKSQLVKIPVSDMSSSNETLQAADTYVKYVYGVTLSAESNEDLATDRVDVLPIWSTPRTRQFRFSVYRHTVAAETLATGFKCVTGIPRNNQSMDCLALPTVNGIYMAGTFLKTINPKDTVQGLRVYVPDTVPSGTVTVKIGISEDVDANIDNSECTTAFTTPFVVHKGYIFRINESDLIDSSKQYFTHAVKVKVLCFVNDVLLPEYVLNAIYMYIHKGITPSILPGFNKWITFPEPSVALVSETGKIRQMFTIYDGNIQSNPLAGNMYDLENTYLPGSTAALRFDVTTESFSSFFVDSVYKVSFKIRNNTGLPLPVALCVSEPTQTGEFYYRTASNTPLSDIYEHSASITVGSDTVEGDFSIPSGTAASTMLKMIPPFKRGEGYKVIIVKPYETVDCSYEQRLSDVPAASHSEIHDLYVWKAFRDTVHPLELVTPSGWFGISKNPNVTKTPQYSSNYYHSISSSEYYATVDAGLAKPVMYNTAGNVGTFKLGIPTWNSVEIAKYVAKAILTSTLTYAAALVGKPTEYIPYAEAPNLIDAEHLYYEHLLLTYGVKDHENTLYISGVDSYITPLQNAIDFSYGSDVTAVIPWRDYIIVFTENATYMLLKDSSSSNGFSTRTVNSQVGVPKSDGHSVQAILNGILFKSGNKAYVYVPGRYSTVDTMLNIRRISDPIEWFLSEGVDTISFVQDDEWHLFQNDEVPTELVYNYAKNVWVRHTHLVFPEDVWLHDTSWRLMLYDGDKVVSYGKDYGELALPDVDLTSLDNITYGDYLGTTNAAFLNVLRQYGVSPAALDPHVSSIPFTLDTGQKSSRFTVVKQFLELKFNLMSLDDKDAFPLTLTVYADGMPHRHVVDANTDSPFWRDSKTLDTGAASTTFGDADTSNVGIMRQMFVKYSGRGKTLRVTFSGESQSRFAVYTVDTRYRVLPNKQ